MSKSPNTDDRSPALGGQHHDPTDAPALGGEALLAHLLEAIEDDDPAIRMRAADALGEMGGEAAISKAAITHLIALLRDPNAALRAHAARALGHARSIEAGEPLLALLQEDQDRVRSAAAEALGRIGYADAVTHLIAATRDRDQVVRQRAAEALGFIGESLPDGSLRDSIPPALIEMMRVSSSLFSRRVTEIVGQALLRVGDDAVPLLLATLAQDSGRMSEAAAGMLTQHLLATRDEELRAAMVDALLDAAAHGEPFVAHTAIRALGAGARGLVQDENYALGQRAVKGLLRLHHEAGPATAPEAITLRAYRDIMRRGLYVPLQGTRYVRPDLAEALGRVGAEHPDLATEALPALIDMLYDEDADTRRAALEALARIAEQHPKAVIGAIPALADRLHDSAGRLFSRQPRISDMAADLLRRLATPDALDALAKAGR